MGRAGSRPLVDGRLEGACQAPRSRRRARRHRPRRPDARPRRPGRRRPAAAAGDPLERPADGRGMRGDRGDDRPRAAHRVDRKPGASRIHRAEAPLATASRAGALRAHRARLVAEGLRAVEALRRAGERRQRRFRHASAGRRPQALERGGHRCPGGGRGVAARSP